MKRRDAVRALLTPETGGGLPAEEPPARVASTAVRAMGLEIGRLTEEARAAEALRRQIEGGEAVVDLAPELVDPSFVSDRLARTQDAEYRQLVESVRESGQLVPILVRPHPEAAGRYQIAYGHRRREAAAELGIPVKVIIRPLSDAELVVAQGKENGERRALSFIERALFAADLQRRGFDRATLNGALGVHTAEMTRLLAVADAIPRVLVAKLGPAPKAGRFRWQELARELARPGTIEAVAALLDQPALRDLPSDRRFDAVMRAIRARGTAPEGLAPAVETIADARGVAVARIERLSGSVRVVLDEHAAPGLARLVLRELPRLIGRYCSGER